MEPVLSKGYRYAHINGSQQLKAGQGVLHTIVVNGLTTAGDCVVYDNPAATGDVIAILHLDPATSISVQPITLIYDCELKTGLYLEFDQSLAADLTVSFI